MVVLYCPRCKSNGRFERLFAFSATEPSEENYDVVLRCSYDHQLRGTMRPVAGSGPSRSGRIKTE